MPTIVWTRHSDTEIRAVIAERHYSIYRRWHPRGIKYYAWCEWRGEFASSGYVSANDGDARISVVDDLKMECNWDALNWGVSSWNWQ
jgi:hypothetical protein